MRVSVAFREEALEFEMPDDRVVGAWVGPEGVSAAGVGGIVGAALEHPRAYPPLRQAVVPGDHVVIALDPTVPEPGALVAALAGVLEGAGVEPADITVLSAGPVPDAAIPPGLRSAVHDPADRAQIAYLATTSAGRRIYLNRHLTDADLVVPVGRLGYDPVLGYGGPWGVIDPGLGDAETQRASRARASDALPSRDSDRPALTESAEVSWLLGSQFHVGVLPSASGLAAVVAGQAATVRAEGSAALDASWTFRAGSRADLVVAGVGAPGRATTLDDLGAGLAAAARLVRRGGKIVALSGASGPLGPAFRRLKGADDPRSGPAALRGHEGDPDYPAARQLAHALAWADVYLLSSLPEAEVEDLSIIPLARPEEARRLAAASSSTTFLGHADRTRAEVADEEG